MVCIVWCSRSQRVWFWTVFACVELWKEPILRSRSKDAFGPSWQQSMILILVNCWQTNCRDRNESTSTEHCPGSTLILHARLSPTLRAIGWLGIHKYLCWTYLAERFSHRIVPERFSHRIVSLSLFPIGSAMPFSHRIVSLSRHQRRVRSAWICASSICWVIIEKSSSGGCLWSQCAVWTQPLAVTSTHQVMIFPKGSTLPRPTNLCWSTFSSRHREEIYPHIFTWEMLCYIFDSLIFPSRIV